MKLRMALGTRFMFSVIILLTFLVGFILFVIGRREVKAIFEEQKKKGILIAEKIAQMNLQPFIHWDTTGVEESIEGQIDEKLVYVVIYDRNMRPFAANSYIKDYEDIYSYSNLSGDEREDAYFHESKKIKEKESEQMLWILEIEKPIFAKGSPIKWGSIKIGLSLKDMHVEILETRLMLILIGLGGLLAGVLGALFLARRITGPIKKLAEGTVRIANGDFSQKIEIDSQDEIGHLAQNFNEMSHQLQLTKERMETAQRRLIQAEKLASIGRISAGIAHEIRNPLTSVKLNIQKILENERLKEVEKDHLSLSQEGIGHIENFIKELLNFTRASELNLNRFAVEQIMEESLKMIQDSLELKNILLEKDFQEGIPEVFVDGDKLRQVFLNILRNACEAVEEGGKITISLSCQEDDTGRKARVEISDDGCGILEEEWENIFEPFYTTKSSGIGLGLSNARKIIEQHQGSIRVKKKESQGACFEILIPCGEQK